MRRVLLVGLMAILAAACADEGATPFEGPRAGERIDQGTTYRYDIYIHCGMEWLGRFNGTWWRTDDPPPYETGAGDMPPGGWTVKDQSVIGTIVLVSEDLIEFRVEGTDVVVPYMPSKKEAPLCY